MQLRGNIGAVVAAIKNRPWMAGSIVRYTATAQAVTLLAAAVAYVPADAGRYVDLVAYSTVACAFVILAVLVSIYVFNDFRFSIRAGLHLADRLTILRLVLVVPLLVLLTDHRYWAALALYVVCVLTDAVDGVIARRRGQTTEFGAVMDPAADIVSTAGVFGALLAIGLVPGWVLVILGVRYGMLIVGSAFLSVLAGPIRFRATAVGKIVGVLQAVIAIIIIVLAASGSSWQQAMGHLLFPLLGVIFTAVIASQLVIGIRHLRQAR